MRSIELFAGIGGIALAAEWAGIETVAFCEREPFAQKVLNKNWPDVPIFDDVCTLNRKVLEEQGVIEPGGTVELISGGFPCQPFSIAGNRKGKEDDRDLWPEMFRIIEEIRPRWVVGENVANFVNMELDRTLSDLESIGYTGKSFVLPAAAVGANHERFRVFVVAHSNSIRDNTKKKCGTDRYREKEMQKRKLAQPGLTYHLSNVRNTNSEPRPQTNQTINTIGEERNTREILAGKHRGESPGKHWETDKPTVCRVDDGIPGGLDKSRLKALGNAVVPQQIYPIFKTIMEIEKGNRYESDKITV